MEQWLGSELLQKAGAGTTKVATTEALAGAEYVMVYFSAHWCPPCRQFTPKLSQFYKTHATSKKFKCVFVSNDKSDAEMSSYFSEMAWDLALPRNDSHIPALSRKCDASGIPTLAVFDAAGNLISKEGVAGVLSDNAEATGFPYKVPDTWELLDSVGHAIDAKGNKTPIADVRSADVVMLYFSAHWCPPCRKTTPMLAKAYNTAVAAGKKVEVLFVSSDNSQAEFDAYLQEMPFKALPYSARDAKQKLGQKFQVRGIPTLLSIDTATGEAVGGSLVGKLHTMPADFPWPPAAVDKLEDATEYINDGTVAVLFTDHMTDAAAEVAVAEAFKAVAQSYFKDGKPDARIRFALAQENDESIDPVRQFLNALRDPDGPTAVRLTIVDVPLQQHATMPLEKGKVPTQEEMAAFVDSYLKGAAEITKLRG